MKARAIVRHYVKAGGKSVPIAQRVDLDEVVIPGLVHIEAMGGGVWHVALGDTLTLSVSRRGVLTVEDLRRRR